MQIEHEVFLRNKVKIGSKGVVKGLRDLLFEFWDPLRMAYPLPALLPLNISDILRQTDRDKASHRRTINGT